ncbi:serine protease Hayan-like [Penaeus indicus]|uniref:serine protease Hayan-like n=1 Tax=Penaeus indicus TaxID=29960 RepID=UPI00300CFA62
MFPRMNFGVKRFTRRELEAMKCFLLNPEVVSLSGGNGRIVIEWQGDNCCVLFPLYRKAAGVPRAGIPNAKPAQQVGVLAISSLSVVVHPGKMIMAEMRRLVFSALVLLLLASSAVAQGNPLNFMTGDDRLLFTHIRGSQSPSIHSRISPSISPATVNCNTPEGEKGTCSLVSQCPPYKPLVADVSNPDILAFFKERICIFGQTFVLLCCPDQAGPSTPAPTESPRRPLVISGNAQATSSFPVRVPPQGGQTLGLPQSSVQSSQSPGSSPSQSRPNRPPTNRPGPPILDTPPPARGPGQADLSLPGPPSRPPSNAGFGGQGGASFPSLQPPRPQRPNFPSLQPPPPQPNFPSSQPQPAQTQQPSFPSLQPQHPNFPSLQPQQPSFPSQQPNFPSQQPSFPSQQPQQPNFPSQQPQQPNFPSQQPQQPTVAQDSAPGKIDIPSEEECGFLFSSTRNTVGRDESKWRPWLVALGQKKGSAFEITCGGALVTSRHVLIAAHCMASPRLPKPTHVRLGNPHSAGNSDGSLPLDLAIAKFVDAGYDLKNLGNDVGVITLERAAPLSDMIRPVCLPYRFMFDGFRYQEVDVTGWSQSATSPQKVDEPAQIAISRASVVGLGVCERTYLKEVESLTLTNQQMCAVVEEDQPCLNDNGAPVTYLDDVTTNKHFLVGLTSFGFGCKQPFSPGVYIRVGAFLEWIEENIK